MTIFETWVQIEEAPNYRVSSFGQVQNYQTGRILNQSKNRQGVVKVTLRVANRQITRSVKRLVAEAFVHPDYDGDSISPHIVFDTPVLLDNDQENLNVGNIVWRPRWFSNQYGRQFYAQRYDRYCDSGPYRDLNTGIVYKNGMTAAMTLGVLAKDVWESSVRTENVNRGFQMQHPGVFPIRHEFENVWDVYQGPYPGAI